MLKKIQIIVFSIIILGGGLSLKICGDQTLKDHFLIFNSSKIEGILDTIRAERLQIYFQLKEKKEVYGFVPYANGDILFERISAKSDSVFKAANSDTLYLYQKDSTYKFTFKKIE
ncbi:hypothetical protein K1X84_10085 [bacterium]|nr:hypothetical protein [bacterium]